MPNPVLIPATDFSNFKTSSGGQAKIVPPLMATIMGKKDKF